MQPGHGNDSVPFRGWGGGGGHRPEPLIGTEQCLPDLLVLEFFLLPGGHRRVRVEQTALDVKGPRFTLMSLKETAGLQERTTDFLLGSWGSFPQRSMGWVQINKIAIGKVLGKTQGPEKML